MLPDVEKKLKLYLNRENHMNPQFEETTFQNALKWLGFTKGGPVSQSTGQNKKAKIQGSTLIHNRHEWAESTIFQMVAVALNVQLVVFTEAQLLFENLNPYYNQNAKCYSLTFASYNDAHAHAHAHAIFISTTTKPLPDLAAGLKKVLPMKYLIYHIILHTMFQKKLIGRVHGPRHLMQLRKILRMSCQCARMMMKNISL